MQFVTIKDLKPGMRLAKPIYNRNGILLFDRDTKLTIPGINSISNFSLLGIYILEPAEPLPPLTREDIEFEQLQTIYMFKLRSIFEKIQKKTPLDNELNELVNDIVTKYGSLDHRVNFNQNLRSADDFMYKHAISTAILCAMISHMMGMTKRVQQIIVAAALLYNIGYCFVPSEILSKSESEFTQLDHDSIQINLEKGLNHLYMYNTKFEFMKKAITLCEYYIFSSSADKEIKRPDSSILSLMKILRVADVFDQTTGMKMNHAPASEIIAMRTLESNHELYDPVIVKALANCIHIVPAGATVDLSNKDKAIVLEENQETYIRPLLLSLTNYQVFDLSDDATFQKFQILDIMKTMDNRVAIDEETLRHFIADERIKATAAKFRSKRRSI